MNFKNFISKNMISFKRGEFFKIEKTCDIQVKVLNKIADAILDTDFIYDEKKSKIEFSNSMITFILYPGKYNEGDKQLNINKVYGLKDTLYHINSKLDYEIEPPKATGPFKVTISL